MTMHLFLCSSFHTQRTTHNLILNQFFKLHDASWTSSNLESTTSSAWGASRATHQSGSIGNTSRHTNSIKWARAASPLLKREKRARVPPVGFPSALASRRSAGNSRAVLSLVVHFPFLGEGFLAFLPSLSSVHRPCKDG